MKTAKQIVRQPIKSTAGILIIALAVAVLVTCVGQYTATVLTRTNLDDRYNTVALLSDTYLWQQNESGNRVHLSELPDEIQNWIDNTVQTRPDLVQADSSTGLVSAYIPELNIDNFSQYEGGDQMGEFNIGNPYRCAMLEVTLTEIVTEVITDTSSFFADGIEQEMLNYVSLLCTARVDGVVGLESGFRKPIGNTILLTIAVCSEEELDALHLQVGSRYLVYGMDYSDMDSDELRNKILNNLPAYEELFGKAPLVGIGLDLSQITNQIDCTMTVCDFSSLPWNTATFDENGAFTGFVSYTDERAFYYADSDGYHMVSVPAEEYIADYSIPTIAALEGTSTKFLASADGVLWNKTLDSMNISNHGFPVLAVDKLGYQPAFSRELARIVDGRDFSESERLNGEKVCIISESLATANGLQVGDTIELRTYAYDPNIEVQRTEMMNSTAFPSAAIYSQTMGFTSEMETYTIVGLYRQENAWQNQNDPYGFTPNTIFVPKAAIDCEMISYSEGIYSTLIIQNGKMDEFMQLQEDAGYPGLFVCYDSGYSEIATALTDYEAVSGRALYIGISVYTVMMVLFVILFPMQQRKTLATMCSLGATRGEQIQHITIGAVALLIPGTMIGAVAGSLLWERVAAKLMESINIQLPLEANMLVTAPALSVCHLVIMTLVVLMIAIALSTNKGLIGRK